MLDCPLSVTYRYRAIYDNIELPLDWPVDVNYHEAKAFCTWKGEGIERVLMS
jgi:hypothetical protein